MTDYRTSKGNMMVMIAFSIILFGMGILYATTLKNRSIGRNNTAYVRVQNCILSIPATSRTEENIDHCYSVIEREFQTKLTRYDKM
jgi:hypothetical protein